MKINTDEILKLTAEVASESDAIFVTDLIEQVALAASWQYDKIQQIWTIEILFHRSEKNKIEQFLEFATETLKFLIKSPTISHLEERDWLRENQESFPPLEIDLFYIYGSHITNPNPRQLLCLKIDAATAFGSGNHGSTKGCLQALSMLHKEIHPNNILDVGCGSGILAMAAAKLWPSAHILASDIDPECVRVTFENCQLNQLEHIQVLEGNGFKNPNIQIAQPFNLIIANILASVLCEIVDDIYRALISGGTVILSGILNTQKDMVIKIYTSRNFIFYDCIQNDEWATLIMKK